MNALPPRNHNNPPSLIDEIEAAYAPMREMAEHWLDGIPVESEPQMREVDTIRAEMRRYRMALEAAQKAETAPLYEAYKAALNRWKPSIEDAQRIEKGLVALVDGYKRRLAAERAEAERRARAEAEAARRAAEEAARAAHVADIEAQRTAAAAQAEAEAAQRRLAEVSRDKVKGLRTVTRHEITDHRALLHWIARHDPDAITEFVREWAAKNHRAHPDADGLRVWTEKVAV